MGLKLYNPFASPDQEGQAAQETGRALLVKAQNVALRVPVIKPSERRLSLNPVSMVKRLYLSRSGRDVVTILDNVSFTLARGERLGLIGPNGAGKTSLLRLLAGVYYSTGGTLDVNGTAQGLFNLQFGMDNAATGVENIVLRGLQMGLDLRTIRNITPSVIEFADIGDNINDLFGNYSAGMKLRVSVAISTMMTPDILLMDEWIGAGDEIFKRKVDHRMQTLITESRALVIATHSETLMRRTCTHGLVLDQGRSVYYGQVDEALRYYMEVVVPESEARKGG